MKTQIIPQPGNYGRYAIADTNGKIIDDAQGYGYKSKQAAYKVANYKFKGGKSRAHKKRVNARKWKKENKDVWLELVKTYQMNATELVKGNITEREIMNSVARTTGTQIPDFIISELDSIDI